ncbi:MAG: DUF4783 domain-containing protein [Spirosomaceae bacterium]|jgi:hypothetical protein|nr:DUF4783 domain-containing protein [Spirosomataceae bacterium]
MKLVQNTFYLLLLLLGTSGYIAPSTSRDVETAEKIKTSFKAGSAHSLAEMFEKNLELVIDAERVDFKRVTNEQAELIVKNFFKKYPPKDFRYGFQGTASRVRYCTATYQTMAGNKFQVYILMRVTDKDYRINTLHFKKE